MDELVEAVFVKFGESMSHNVLDATRLVMVQVLNFVAKILLSIIVELLSVTQTRKIRHL